VIVLLPVRRLAWYAPAAWCCACVRPLIARRVGRRLWLVDAFAAALGSSAVLVACSCGLAEADAQRRRLRRELEAQPCRRPAAASSNRTGASDRHSATPEGSPATHASIWRRCSSRRRRSAAISTNFFLVDHRHLFIAVGDVTGKGVPRACSWRSARHSTKARAARRSSIRPRSPRPPTANLARQSEMLFITFFAGLLDLETGLLHSAMPVTTTLPALPGEAPRQIERHAAARPRSSRIRYTANSYQLTTRRAFVPVTDGVTEAMDKSGALLGHAPVLASWRHCRKNTAPQMRLAAFARTPSVVRRRADPSDDLTARRCAGTARVSDHGAMI